MEGKVEKAHVNPIWIFLWLVAITALEVGGAMFFALPRKALVIFLVGTAMAKASLVALYFMELRFERRLVIFVIVAPVIIAIAFVLILFPDIVVRGYWGK